MTLVIFDPDAKAELNSERMPCFRQGQRANIKQNNSLPVGDSAQLVAGIFNFWQLFGITKAVNLDWDVVLEIILSPLCKRLQKHLFNTG